MRLVLLGPPGAGKGTHAQILATNENVAHISTGDMLRDAIRKGTDMGLKAKQYMDSGALVPDELVISMVSARLRESDAKNGFILDGFPRTVDQAKSLDSSLVDLAMPIDVVLYFKTSLATIIRRLSGRRVCGKCGKNYHIQNFKPKADGICDRCGSALVQRPDDREETIEHRLKVYEAQTEPLIAYYTQKGVIAEVSGDLEVEPLKVVLKELFAQRLSR